MKIRSGFVSNSSSSSFVLIGVEVTQELDDKLEKKYGTDWKNEGDLEDAVQVLWETGNGDLVGIVVITDSDGYLEDGNISLAEFNTMASEVSQVTELDVSEIKIFYGTHAS
ncbi:unnamed protein product [marine sediment metagenome]|uniref:Uncharacterized protein n=1 Tax=marine sediment metagenome TaxID=412755 RepID=X0W679_9ZZZZ